MPWITGAAGEAPAAVGLRDSRTRQVRVARRRSESHAARTSAGSPAGPAIGRVPRHDAPPHTGHEIAGRVDKVGANVTEWKAGDRVGVGWHGGHDFVCNACQKGLFVNCEKAQITGISHDGGYAEYVVVPHEAIARIPEKLSAIDAGPRSVTRSTGVP
jgi:threonine dehydrogenase-like Zn-dependent dehydrogenase